MKDHFKILLISALLLLFTGCRKDDRPKTQEPCGSLPAPTQEGLNTFGCIVDEFCWEPKGFILPKGNLEAFIDYYDSIYVFYISARRSENYPPESDIGIQITSKISLTETTYTIGFNHESPIGVDVIDYGSSADYSAYYTTNDTTGGEITITKLDTTNHIISGTFYFDVVKLDSNIIKITKGRFDLKYD